MREETVSRVLGDGDGALLSGIYIKVLRPTIFKRGSIPVLMANSVSGKEGRMVHDGPKEANRALSPFLV